MNNKQQLIKQIEKLQLQLKELENQDYQQIIYNKKNLEYINGIKHLKIFLCLKILILLNTLMLLL